MELVMKYRKTQKQEFLGELYNRHMTLVMGVSMKYLHNEHDSSDAVMEIFEVVREDLLKYEVSYFKSWLYMVTKNYCLMRKSKLRTQQKREENYQRDSRTFMESESAIHLMEEDRREEQLTQLENCIETLRDQQKQCIELFYLREKCYLEIAESTGYALSKVKSYIQNGKRNLKLCLERKNERQLA